jgi:hypothetical protein
MNAIAAVGGIVLLVCGMACFGMAFTVEGAQLPIFALGLVLVASSFGLPILVLDRLDR